MINWKSQSLKLHYWLAAAYIPIIIFNEAWAIIPLILATIWVTIVFFKAHKLYNHD